MRRLVDQSIHRIDEALCARSDGMFLHVFVEKDAARSLYRASIALSIAGRALAAQEEHHNAVDAIGMVFAELEQEIRMDEGKHPDADHDKHPVRKARPVQNVIPGERRNRTLRFNLIDPHLEAVYNFSQREIGYHVAVGDLPSGELAADDVVAAVVLRASRELRKGFEKREIRGWLIRAALEHIDAEVARATHERERTVHIEDDIPETPPAEAVSTLGDPTLDFHQPDEDLKLEDVLPQRSMPSPEQILESRELQRYVTRALARLPRDLRLAFVLRYVEGLPIAAMTRVTGQSQPEIERNIADARRILRQRLAEAGVAPSDEAARIVFGTAPTAQVTPALRDALKRQVGAGATAANLAGVAGVTT